MMKECNINKAISAGLLLLFVSAGTLFAPAYSDTIHFANGSSLPIPREKQSFELGKDFHVFHLVKGITIYSDNFAELDREKLLKDGVKIGKNTTNNYLSIEAGNVLLSPEKDIVVGVRGSDIHISAGAVLFAMVLDDGLVLYDLRQSRPDQVSVLVNGSRLNLDPGYMMVFSGQNTKNFEKLDLDCHTVIHGPAQKISLLTKETKIFVAGFSISAAFLTIEPLKQLIASNDKQDKLVFERILRGAVSLKDHIGPIPPAQLANMSRQL